MEVRSRKLTLSAMFIALGILFPILFHSVGVGNIFLPMFWPVATSAFFLPILYTIAVGTLTPLVSSLVTGMPPISPPIVYIMMLELAFLSGTTSFLYQWTRWGLFWLLFVGLFVSRAVLFLSAASFAPILGLPPNLVSTGSVIQGIPGVIAILILVPIIVKRVKNDVIWELRNTHV